MWPQAAFGIRTSVSSCARLSKSSFWVKHQHLPPAVLLFWVCEQGGWEPSRAPLPPCCPCPAPGSRCPALWSAAQPQKAAHTQDCSSTLRWRLREELGFTHLALLSCSLEEALPWILTLHPPLEMLLRVIPALNSRVPSAQLPLLTMGDPHPLVHC